MNLNVVSAATHQTIRHCRLPVAVVVVVVVVVVVISVLESALCTWPASSPGLDWLAQASYVEPRNSPSLLLLCPARHLTKVNN